MITGAPWGAVANLELANSFPTSTSVFLPVIGTMPRVCVCQRCLFLTPSQDLSQHRGSFGAHGFWFGRCVYRGVLRGVGRPCHLHCPIEEETRGKWRDRLLMMRIEMQHLTHLRSRSRWRTAQGGMTRAELLDRKFLLKYRRPAEECLFVMLLDTMYLSVFPSIDSMCKAIYKRCDGWYFG